MSTGTAQPVRQQAPAGNGTRPDRTALDAAIEATISRETITWKAADTGEEFNLSISHVRKLFANPTKSGKMPTDRDCWMFLQLCKARGLNPYVGDAFLVGYDEDDGKAKFSLITAHQALLKRAEASGKKKGMESGVIIRDKTTKEIRETPGDFVDDGDTLLGGWCKVYRKDYEIPIYERVKLSTYNKGWGRWRADPAGMIVKVAEAGSHRLAFPSETGGMYLREEMDRDNDDDDRPNQADLTKAKSKSDRIADELAAQFPGEPEKVEEKTKDPGKPIDQPFLAIEKDVNQRVVHGAHHSTGEPSFPVSKDLADKLLKPAPVEAPAATEKLVEKPVEKPVSKPAKPVQTTKPATEPYGDKSDRWMEMMTLIKQDNQRALDAKERLGWLNTPFMQLRQTQIVALIDEIKKPPEQLS